jgi:hypothetical protein
VHPVALAAREHADRFCWSEPLKLKLAHVGAAVDLAVADLHEVDAAGDLLVHGLVGVERSRLWST